MPTKMAAPRKRSFDAIQSTTDQGIPLASSSKAGELVVLPKGRGDAKRQRTESPSTAKTMTKSFNAQSTVDSIPQQPPQVSNSLLPHSSAALPRDPDPRIPPISTPTLLSNQTLLVQHQLPTPCSTSPTFLPLPTPLPLPQKRGKSMTALEIPPFASKGMRVIRDSVV